MTRTARLGRYLHDGAIRHAAVMGTRGGLLLELELFHPPSAEGQRVLLHLGEDDIDALLKELRAYAIEARRHPGPPTNPGPPPRRDPLADLADLVARAGGEA
jgi:hypothetical protein